MLIVATVSCSKSPNTATQSAKSPASAKSSATATSSAEDRARATERQARNETIRTVLRESLNTSARRHVEALRKAPFYDISVEMVGKMGYSGTQKVAYTNRTLDTIRDLTFFLYPNTEHVGISSGAELVVNKVTADGIPVSTQQVGPTLRVPLPKPLRPGQEVIVEMRFQGHVVHLKDGSSDMWKLAMDQLVQMFFGDDSSHGGYGIYSYGDGITSLGLWYPVLSARRDGQWDLEQGGTMGDVSFFDVSNYRVRVNAPSDMTIVTTGVEVKRTLVGERIQTEFLAGGVREFCVQMSPQYRRKSAFVDGVKVTSWFLAEHEAAGVRVLDQGSQALRVFNKAFGAYPYTELDLVEAPLVGGAGGVEFPGLVTLAKMFYGADTTGSSGLPKIFGDMMTNNPMMQDTLEFVVAHEVAHQWWNAVVGSDSKNHPFVDEALANHSAVLYFETIHGAEAGETQRELQLRLPYQIARMAGAKDRPVDLPTDQYDSTLEYAAIVYGKGALFFHALREEAGAAAHDRFLRDYYHNYAFQIADPKDLIGGLVRAAPAPEKAQALADRWLKGTHGDEDIGALRLSSLFRSVLGDTPLEGPLKDIVTLLDSKGVQELSKWVKNILSPDGTLKEDVDYGSIMQLLGNALGSEEDSSGLGTILTDLVKVVGDSTDPSGGEIDTTKLFTGLLKQLAGEDEDTKALIDATGTLLDVLSRMDD